MSISKKQLVIIDDYLPKEEFLDLKKRSLKMMGSQILYPTYYGLETTISHDYMELSDIMLYEASKHYDLKSYVGYEIWTQNNTRPAGKHTDKDDIYYEITGKEVNPICTVVYYLKVDHFLKGGKLNLESVGELIPKENRMIIFGPGLYHEVHEYEGERVSVILNPWNKPPYQNPEDVPMDEVNIF
mgnify:CR=1 FL=1